MSSGSDLSLTTTLTTVTTSTSSAAGVPPPRCSRFLYSDPSSGLTSGVLGEEHCADGDGFGLYSISCWIGTSAPCYFDTSSLLGSPAGTDGVESCPCGVILHYPSGDHFRYALIMPCKSCCATHPFWHWGHLTIQWQVFGAAMQWDGLACIPEVVFDRGHELF